MFEKRSLGIALAADGSVRVVEVSAGFRSATLSRVWNLGSEGGDIFESWKQGLGELRGLGVHADATVLGIPDSVIFRKQLQFPFSNRRRILEILTSELDGEIPLPIGSVVADFVPGSLSGTGVAGTAMACDKNELSRFLDLLGTDSRLKSVKTGSIGLAVASARAGLKEGVSVHCAAGEAVLVELRGARVTSFRRMALTRDGDKDAGIVAQGIRQYARDGDEIRLGCPALSDGITRAFSTEGDYRIRVLSESDVVPGGTETGRETGYYVPAIGLALSGLGHGPAQPFDLRQGPFKEVTPLAGLRGPIIRSSALVVLTLLLGIASLYAGLHQVRGEYGNLKDQLDREFKSLLPASRHIDGQETAQLRGELEGLERRFTALAGMEGRGAVSILGDLSAAVPPDVSLRLEELSYDSRKLRFEGSVPSFDAVDRVKAALEAEPAFTDVQVQNARVGADINKVTFRVQMEVR